MKLYTNNFLVSEFASKDEPRARMCMEFMNKLQLLRDDFRHVITINSGIRSEKENKEVGGSINSKHLTRPCIACDISTSNMKGVWVHKLLRLAFQHGFTGIGVGKYFIHLDMRKTATTWTY